jgi:alpha-beta hydrolase superfamily lysophospholipase
MHSHSETTVIGAAGLPLFAQKWWPSGRARASLAIVHGFGEHSGRYGNVVDWFVPRQHAVYALDLRGHGRSPGRRGHINRWGELVEDVRALLRWAASDAPGTPLFLVGHSLGGVIVPDLTHASQQGLAGIVISAPSLGDLPVSPALIALAKVMSRIWPLFTQDVHLDETALSRDQTVGQAYRTDPLVHNLSSARFGTELLSAVRSVRAQAALSTVPCLIIHGGADRISPPESSREYFDSLTIADKTRYEYEGYYHEVFNDIGKERVLADVERWIEQHLTLAQ